METERLDITVNSFERLGTRVVKLRGPLVLRTFFDFQTELRRDVQRLNIIDMSEVPYMDSTGIGTIVNFYVHCQSTRTHMMIVGPNYRVMEVFRAMRVDSVLRIVPSIEEALKNT
jgi:anti-sigma B factor antagonist